MLQRALHSEALTINLDPVKTSGAPALKIAAVFYWQGRYISFCDRCRRTHPHLKDIPDQELQRIEIEVGFMTLRSCALSTLENPHGLDGRLRGFEYAEQ